MTWTLTSPGDSGLSNPINNNFKHGFWGQAVYGADTDIDDTYVVTLSPAPTSLLAGMIINFKVTTANTGACTLNPNSLGATAIKKNVSEALQTGDIIASTVVSVIFDGTNFQLLNPQSPGRARVSSNDTTDGYLNGKLVASSGITLTENSDGNNETLGISIENDAIKDSMIDWGTGAGQVSADDIPVGSTNKFGFVASGCLVSMSGTQVINGTIATVQFNTETFDIAAEFNTGTYTFTATNAGYYLVGGYIRLSAYSGVPNLNAFFAQVTCATSVAYYGYDIQHGTIPIYAIPIPATAVYLAASGTIAIRVNINAGDSGTITNTGSWLSIIRVS